MSHPFGIGQPVRRKEDWRLVTGQGEYSDDLNLPGQVYAHVLRSPHAHALINAVDASAALAMPGVIAVLIGRDYVADGLKPLPNRPIPPDLPLANRDGSPAFVPPDFPLAVDKARHVGEGVALIVAESRDTAIDAAEKVVVDYEVLPCAVDVADAVATGAAALWDGAPGNVCVDGDRGDPAAVDAALAKAAHVTRMNLRNNRVNGIPMEPGVAVAAYDAASGIVTLRAPGQGILIQRDALAVCLGLDNEHVRVICRDVGGGFGTRNLLYREHVMIAWAARRLGRPVKWRADRSESFLCDPYGRDLTTTAELALDAQGNFLAIRVHNIANIGSQTLHLVPLCRGAAVTNGVYVIPAIHARLQAVFTNTVPTSTYRGAGRPEAMHIIERLIDTAAAEMGIDRFELRRRNMIRPDMLPWVSPINTRYDSGEFAINMRRALELGDHDGFAARRAESKARGRLRGFGLGNYIETATGIPFERAVIYVHPDRCSIVLGTQASGQGHETAFAQMMVDFLGVPFEQVEFRHGDTDFVKMGSGSHSARSMRLGGLLLGRASAEILAKAKPLAAAALQASEAEVVFVDGSFRIAGSARAIGMLEVAAYNADLPASQRVALAASSEISTMLPNFPNGCHVAEVEIDPGTGAVSILRYVAIDDVGRVINPMLCDGQAHGSTVQGIGQALMEDCVYDRDSGQLLSGSFMDYAMPRADQFPFFEVEVNEVLAPNNPLGVKGGGEGGSTGAPPAIVNAIVDALKEFGVRDVQMPATPERIWRALQGNGGER